MRDILLAVVRLSVGTKRASCRAWALKNNKEENDREGENRKDTTVRQNLQFFVFHAARHLCCDTDISRSDPRIAVRNLTRLLRGRFRHRRCALRVADCLRSAWRRRHITTDDAACLSSCTAGGRAR